MNQSLPGLAYILICISTSCSVARSELESLSGNPNSIDYLPEWSPDGRKIVFTSLRDGNAEIYVMDSDGSNPIPLTNRISYDHFPRWSPDGSTIAFESMRDFDSEIYLMDADGGNKRRLTHTPGRDQKPRWSPDGSEIVFSSQRNGNLDIFIMAADGSNQRPLTDHPGWDSQACISPDGTKIAYVSDQTGRRQIHLMDIDGSQSTPITNQSEGWLGFPQWSPNGLRIGFDSRMDGNDLEIYSMRVDGSDLRRLTKSRDLDNLGGWSADGMKILFSSRRDGRRGIYTMNTDGSLVRKLTNTRSSEFVRIARADGVDTAITRFRRAKKHYPDLQFFLEAEVNLLAHTHLDEGNTADALRLLTLNTEAYPESWNAFLSLGDVHLQLRNKSEAVSAFERALSLNPGNAGTVGQLRRARVD